MEKIIKTICEETGVLYKPTIVGIQNIPCKYGTGHKVRIDVNNGNWSCDKRKLYDQPFDEKKIIEVIKWVDKPEAVGNDDLAIYWMSETEPEEIEWLWYPFIPKGKMMIIDGDPSIGKTWATVDICARVSAGLPMPDSTQPTESGKVMYCTMEDTAGDIRKRLGTIGHANLNNIAVFSGKKSKDGFDVPFDFGNNIESFKKAVEQIKPSVVVIDPLQSFIGVDMNKANETRPALQRMVTLAKEYNFALIILRHLTKGGKEKGLYRGMGSIDIIGTARAAVYVGQHKTDPLIKVWAHNKYNLAKKTESLEFAIQDPGCVKWLGKSEYSSDDLNNQFSGDKCKDKESAVDKAIKFLEEAFKEEESIESKILQQGAEMSGISKTALNSAKEELGYEAVRKNKKWYTVKKKVVS